MPALEKVRYPKQVKPPDGVGHELAHYKRPRLAMRKQANPFDFPVRFGWIAADVSQFGFRDSGVLLRFAIQH